MNTLDENIGLHGMSPSNSVYGEPITLSDGKALDIVWESDDRVCVSVEGTAARYTKDELGELGFGNANAGLMSVVRAVRENPQTFEFGEGRPLMPKSDTAAAQKKD